VWDYFNSELKDWDIKYKIHAFCLHVNIDGSQEQRFATTKNPRCFCSTTERLRPIAEPRIPWVKNQLTMLKNIQSALSRGEALKKRTITDGDEVRLQKAKLDYEARWYSSIKAAPDANDVPYFTLRRRIRGLALHKKEAHINQQLLTFGEQRAWI